VDEVALFNRQLGAAEITAQYAAATGSDAPGTILGQSPAGYWRLKDPATAAVITAVNQGSAGAAANGVYNGAGTLGGAGPRPA
jgi:hypothetical protein